jgi:manganese/zinc/iron transport system permease protein
MIPEAEIIIIASLVAITCAVPGVFLVLRKMSLMSDAISHSILLGIIIAFFLTQSLSSPLLIVGAALTGVLTVSLTELLVNTRKVKEDAAIGLVFPALFSIAVILISKFAKNVHIDMDAVLLGEVAFAPFNRLTLFGINLPESLWVMGTIFIVNLIFIILFYKEMKLATFDAGLAAALGFFPGILHYALMSLVSITAVGAFDVVGSVLVVAFIIAPAGAAYLLTEKLHSMIFLSAGIGVLSTITGYGLARVLDASIAGSMATMTGVFFLLAFFFAPEKGLFAKLALQYKQKWLFACHMITVHLLDHEGKPDERIENKASTLDQHLKWEKDFTKRVVGLTIKKGFVVQKGELLKLTPLGKETAKQVMMMS